MMLYFVILFIILYDIIIAPTKPLNPDPKKRDRADGLVAGCDASTNAGIGGFQSFGFQGVVQLDGG